MNLRLSLFPPNSISSGYCACKSSLAAICFEANLVRVVELHVMRMDICTVIDRVLLA